MFQKASKKQCKLRLALFGVSGGGKTYSSLLIAKGLGGKVALIDTEHKSASKYADRFDFDVCNLDKPTIGNMLMTIKEARDYDVLIIDSLTHAWLELLQEVEKIARAKFGGNSWSAWSEGTPKQQSLINALLEFPGHIIVTMRSDTNWTTSLNDKGKVVPIRIGEAPKQGKNIEYEFDMLIQLSQDHMGLVLKDRTGKYQDQCFMIDEKFGSQLGEWLQDGDTAQCDDVEEVDFCSGLPPIIEEHNSAPQLCDEELVEDFKKRVLKLLKPKQVKLFMKKHKLTVDDSAKLHNWLANHDLELTIASFLEEVNQ